MSDRVTDLTIRNDRPTAADPLIGRLVEQYRVEAVIGSGAMGIVYRAVHELIGKTVALKVLKADFADDVEMVQRLVREARTVNAIRHPAIVDVFGFGTLPKTQQPYIVMDLLVGMSLDLHILTHGPMSMDEAVPLLDELLSALAAAHAVGVIHRDLKPGNVFVESKPDGKRGVKVIDFGLAKQSNRSGGSVHPTNPGTLLGTPAFMAPEQVAGGKVTPAADLYAVGGIAYQMLTTHLPHEGETALDVLTQKMQQQPVPAKSWQPSLSDELDAWVLNLLEREPEKRVQSAEEARRRLRRIADGRTKFNAVSTAVVPKRQWHDARTVLAPGMPMEVEMAPIRPSQSRGEVVTIAAHPSEVGRTPSPPKRTEFLQEDVVQKFAQGHRSSRNRRLVMGAVASVAVAAVLWWIARS